VGRQSMGILKKKQRGPWPVLLTGVLALAALTLFFSQRSKALALPGGNDKEKPATAPGTTEPGSDSSRQVVAYIYGTTPITRRDLGEYLIARHGADSLELLVNKRIIEQCCKEKGIQVTAAEVDSALAEDLKGMGVNLKDFVDQVLKHYNKTLYEWKE